MDTLAFGAKRFVRLALLPVVCYKEITKRREVGSNAARKTLSKNLFSWLMPDHALRAASGLLGGYCSHRSGCGVHHVSCDFKGLLTMKNFSKSEAFFSFLYWFAGHVVFYHVATGASVWFCDEWH